MSDLKRWRGLKALVSDAVQSGTSAVEQVHLATASRPFAVLEAIPGLSAPAQVVHRIHDAIVAQNYGAVRVAARAVDKGADLVLNTLERRAGSGSDSGSESDGSPRRADGSVPPQAVDRTGV